MTINEKILKYYLIEYEKALQAQDYERCDKLQHVYRFSVGKDIDHEKPLTRH